MCAALLKRFRLSTGHILNIASNNRCESGATHRMPAQTWQTKTGHAPAGRIDPGKPVIKATCGAAASPAPR
eukprot:SAG31_NODE_15891_length_733_cov_1.129338_1_plen_70_part_01